MILMVVCFLLSQVYVYLVLLAVFLFVKLLGGNIVKFICVNIFSMSKNEIISDKDFSCITNASFYLLCAIFIVYNDVCILNTTIIEYGLLDIFLRGILAYLALDNALPILKSGLLVFDKNKIKKRSFEFILTCFRIKKLLKIRSEIIKRIIIKKNDIICF